MTDTKKSNVKTTAAAAAASVLFPGLGVGLLAANMIATQLGKPEKTEEAIRQAQDAAAVERELSIQRALLQLAEDRARVARELAIARRIDTAEEVELEEHFDHSVEGKAGLQMKEKGAELGLSGAGRTVSKRVYRFKGWREGGLEALVGQLSEDDLRAVQKIEHGAEL